MDATVQQTVTLVLIVLRRFMRRFSRCAYVYTTKKYAQRNTHKEALEDSFKSFRIGVVERAY